MHKKAELVKDYFVTIYLTIIALLMGVALVQLVPHMIYFLNMDKFDYDYAPPLILTLISIFIVWHHYTLGILYLRWFPNILDALILFGIGIAVFFMVSFLEIDPSTGKMNLTAWMKTFATFLIAGSIAYFAAAARHEAELFLNIMNQPSAQAHKKNIRYLYIREGISMLIQSALALVIAITHWEKLLWASFALFIVHIIWAEYYHIRIIKPGFLKSISN